MPQISQHINPNLGGGGILPPLPPSWFFLNNSKTLKAVTPAFLQHSVTSYQKHSCQIWYPELVHNSILDKTQTGISDFRISGQSLIKENCYNARTIDDIDMKLRPVTKRDKRNKTTSKKFDDDVMSGNSDVIVIFGFLTNLKQSGGRIPETESAKIMFSIVVTFCLTETENRTKKSLTQLSHQCFE